MFIECIDSEGFEDQLEKTLMYQVKELGQNGYLIVNNLGQTRWYGNYHFTISRINL